MINKKTYEEKQFVVRNSNFSNQEFEEAEASLKEELNSLIKKWEDRGHFIRLEIKEKGITHIIDKVIFVNKHFKILEG